MLTALRRSWRLRHAHRRAGELLASYPRPEPDGRVALVGPDLVRILLVGAGTAVGYGVRLRAHALDGRLAEALFQRTGRGVVVDTRVRRDLRLHDTVELLGPVGAHTYDAVIWAPTFREAFRFRTAARWRRSVERIVGHLRSTGTAGTRIVLLGLPELDGTTAMTHAVAEQVLQVNRGIAAAAAELGVLHVAVPPSPATPGTVCPWDAHYYARAAAQLADALVPAPAR